MSDTALRSAALAAVQTLWRRFGDAVPYSAIAEGFSYEDERVPFLSTFEGMYKPTTLARGALSVRSTLASRYTDERLSDDRTWYEYSPHDSRNRWVRENLEDGTPLLYFLQVRPKPGVEYLIFAPTEVIEDDVAGHRFLLDLSPSHLYEPIPDHAPRVFERRYGVSHSTVRLFQAHFRRSVLAAYRNRCAVCVLRERPLLDGAHLVPDREEIGEPRVSNGLSLCATHHRALDRDLLGITPELNVHVFRERMEHPDEDAAEILTRYDGASLRLPREPADQPDRDLVAWRWEQTVEVT